MGQERTTLRAARIQVDAVWHRELLPAALIREHHLKAGLHLDGDGIRCARDVGTPVEIIVGDGQGRELHRPGLHRAHAP